MPPMVAERYDVGDHPLRGLINRFAITARNEDLLTERPTLAIPRSGHNA
jgi:hypothetical protein